MVDTARAAPPSRAEINAFLLKSTQEASKALPVGDEEVVVFAVKAGDLRVTYYGQLTDVSTKELKSATAPVVEALHGKMINDWCTTPKYRRVLDLGVTVEYVYYDNVKVYAVNSSVSVRDCDQPAEAH
jgi:hypothetical protein